MRKFGLSAAVALSVVLISSPLPAQVETPIAPIATNSGAVAGAVLASGVRVWLGVPFAKPPVGDLRWRPPQPIAWKGVWNADRRMPECMQVLRPHDIDTYFGEEATSEDCLYLNIWAPPGVRPGAKLPVVVFIYGGGGTIGSAGSPLYDGESLAKKGVLFVSIAYRLGILGFMAHPQLTREQGGHSGNYAFLDQNAALAWIHDNIAGFGGDPGRVALSGQSAGAVSVSAQMYSPLSKGLFWAAMMSSVCSIGPAKMPSLAEGEQTGLQIQKTLGAADLKAMRNIAADRIVRLQAENQVGYNIAGLRAGPIQDGYFFTRPEEETFRSHALRDVPVMANFNSGESVSPLQKARTVQDYSDIARRMFGKDADAFLKLYPVAKESDIAAMAAKQAREAGIANLSRQCGVFQALYNTSPVFIDMFDRRHPLAPGVTIADQDPATAGAYHFGDLVYWLGNLDIFNRLRHTRDWTPRDRELAGEMSDALVAFAGSGNPSTPALPWPAWSAKRDVFVDFGDATKVVPFNSKGMAWLAAHAPAGGR